MREIFFTILEINIAAAAIIVLFCIFAGKLRKRYGAEWMKLVWLLLAVRLAIPFNISMPFPEIRLFNSPGFERENGNTGIRHLFGRSLEESGEDTNRLPTDRAGTDAGRQEAGGLLTNWSDGEAHGLLSDEADGETHGQSVNAAGSDTNGQPVNAAGGNNVTPAADFKAASQNTTAGGLIADRTFPYANIMLLLWLVGVGICLLYVFTGYLSFFIKSKKTMRPLKDENLRKQISEMQRKILGKARIPVYQSFYITSPMMTGIFSPRLVIPVSGKKWSRQELEMIISHELCHYQKRDLLLKFFITMVWCVNWFNPAVFFMKKQFFYDVELACDENVLKKCSEEEREAYARMILSVAGKRKKMPVFSTGFTEDKKRMASRIDHIFDSGDRKRGTVSILAAGILILVMSVAVSCGYVSEEDQPDKASSESVDGEPTAENLPGEKLLSPETGQDGAATPEKTAVPEESEAPKEAADFDSNHTYNAMIRVYGNDVYIAREDGIYRIRDGEGEEEPVFENAYSGRRGMEIYQHYLFFSGSADRGGEEAATIYRMDLNTLDVTDALAAYSRIFQNLLNISVYEDNLYVAEGSFHRTGFALTPEGEIGSPLDEDADTFLYKEYNKYAELELQQLNAVYGSAEGLALAEELAGLYQPLIDVADCKKLLHGSQVVSRYKDEACREAYLAHEDGTYEYLCDIYDGYGLVTETGLYYCDGTNGDILYVDFETRQSETIYSQPENWSLICLLTYDADYIYLVTSTHLGFDEEDNTIREDCLQRIPRQGGAMEKIREFETDLGWRMPYNFFRNCGVYNGYMYLKGYETVSLNPEQNS